MSDAAPSPPLPEPPPSERSAPDEVGPATAVTLLFDEARAAVVQEMAFARAFATAAGLTARTVAIFAGLAALLALVAIIVLAIGLMLSLAPLVSMLGATAIVVGLLLACAGIAAWLVRRAIRRFQHAINAHD
jgi:uncharacterized membrane protein